MGSWGVGKGKVVHRGEGVLRMSTAPASQKILITHPAVLDSKKPGLLRVKVMVYQMSWQKCMSFVKCSDLKVKEVICFTLCHQRDK